MKHLRDEGWIVAKVEQRLPIPGKFVTRDCFNLGDLLCADVTMGIALIQVTTNSNLAAHLTKAMAIKELRTWLLAGGRFILHGWAKMGPRGEKKEWKLTERNIGLADIPNESAE